MPHHRDELLDALGVELATALAPLPVEVQGVKTLDPAQTPVLRIHLGPETEIDLAGATDGLARSQRIDFVYFEWGEVRRTLTRNAGDIDDKIWNVLAVQETSIDQWVVPGGIRYVEREEVVFFEHDLYLLAATLGYDFIYTK